MPGENNQYVNPNVADSETLRRLPGIGAEIAKQLIAARPFKDAEDLSRVPGLGQSTLEQITPYLMFDSDQPQDESTSELVVDADIYGSQDSHAGAKFDGDESLEQAIESPAEASDPQVEQDEPTLVLPESISAAPAPQPGYTRSESLWLMAGIGALALIFSVILSLAIVGGINGTLDFRQISAFRSLQSDVALVEGNLESVSADLESMTQRLVALEGLTGRVVTVEEQVDLLQSDIESALDTVGTMQEDLGRIDEETARLSDHVATFDGFLQGMREILDDALGTAPDEAPLP